MATYTFRLSATGIAEIKTQLEALGPAGQAAFDRIQQAAQKATTNTTAFTGAAQQASTGSRNFGAIIGQAGFQIQDFAIQIQSGTNALTAFAQQGSQLLGIFGPAGAIAGAALAVGAIAANMIGLGRETRAAAQATDSFKDVFSALSTRLKAGGVDLDDVTQKYRELARVAGQAASIGLRADIQSRQNVNSDLANTVAANALRDLRISREALARGTLDPTINQATGQFLFDRDVQAFIETLDRAGGKYREFAQANAESLSKFIANREAIQLLSAQLAQLSGTASAAQTNLIGAAEGGRSALDRTLEWARQTADEVSEENAKARTREEQERAAFRQRQNRADLDALIDRLDKERDERLRLIADVERDTVAAQRREREQAEREWERFGDRAAQSISDVLYDTLTDNLGNFWELFRRLGMRAVADIAAQLISANIVVPIAQGVIGGGAGSAVNGLSAASSLSNLTGFSPFSSIGGLSGIGASINGAGYSSGLFGIGAMNTPAGFSPAASGALGAGTATQFLGAAGAGFGGGYLLSSATGNRAIGGIGGAGIGGLMAYGAGFGPWGIAAAAGLGVLGGVLGGGGQRGDPYVQGSIALGPDGRLVGRAAADNRGDPSGTQQQIDQAIAQLQSITSARGLQFTRGADLFGDRTGRTLEQALDEIASGVRAGPTTSARVRSAIDGGGITSLQGLTEALSKADEIDAFTESVRRATLAITDENALALEDQEKAAQARLDQARRLGLDLTEVERLNALERAEVIKAVNDNAVRESQEAFDLILQGAAERRRAAEEEARAQQAATDAYRQSIASVGDRLVQEAQRIREEVDAALLGPYSNLSPEARLALAQQRFQSGQLGLNDFLGEGARAYGTATTAYASFFDDALSSARARAANLDAAAANVYASLREAPGFATGGSFDVVGPPGNDNIYLPRLGARFTAGETVNVSTRDTMATLVARVDVLIGLHQQLLAATVGIGGEQLAVTDQVRRSFAGMEAIQRHRASAA